MRWRLGIAICLALWGCQAGGPGGTEEDVDGVAPPGGEQAEPTTQAAPPGTWAAGSGPFETTIHLPAWTGQARTGEIDAQGRLVTMECVACHRELTEREEAPTVDQLEKVHRGLQMQHGDLSCYSCHDPGTDYANLRLADGSAVAYEQVMTLCSQCHGPQRRDYDRGAHGGMNGYWDLARGPRERNACTVCHDPHAPAFPRMRPMFKPHDRFLTPSHASGTGRGTGHETGEEGTHAP